MAWAAQADQFVAAGAGPWPTSAPNFGIGNIVPPDRLSAGYAASLRGATDADGASVTRCRRRPAPAEIAAAAPGHRCRRQPDVRRRGGRFQALRPGWPAPQRISSPSAARVAGVDRVLRRSTSRHFQHVARVLAHVPPGRHTFGGRAVADRLDADDRARSSPAQGGSSIVRTLSRVGAELACCRGTSPTASRAARISNARKPGASAACRRSSSSSAPPLPTELHALRGQFGAADSRGHHGDGLASRMRYEQFIGHRAPRRRPAPQLARCTSAAFGGARPAAQREQRRQRLSLPAPTPVALIAARDDHVAVRLKDVEQGLRRVHRATRPTRPTASGSAGRVSTNDRAGEQCVHGVRCSNA